MSTGIGAINAASPRILKGSIARMKKAGQAGAEIQNGQQAGAKQDVFGGGFLSPKAKTNAANLGSQMNFNA